MSCLPETTRPGKETRDLDGCLEPAKDKTLSDLLKDVKTLTKEVDEQRRQLGTLAELEKRVQKL